MEVRYYIHPLTGVQFECIDGVWFRVRGIYLDPCREPHGVQEVIDAV